MGSSQSTSSSALKREKQKFLARYLISDLTIIFFNPDRNSLMYKKAVGDMYYRNLDEQYQDASSAQDLGFLYHQLDFILSNFLFS